MPQATPACRIGLRGHLAAAGWGGDDAGEVPPQDARKVSLPTRPASMGAYLREHAVRPLAPRGPVQSSDSFRLQLFGPPALVRTHPGGTTETVMGPGKPLLILAHLSAHPGGVARESLAALAWGDQDGQRARGSLRQAMYRVRQLLGPEATTATDETVTLQLTIPSDREDFLTAIAAGDDMAAVALYRGPFLAGISGSDTNGLFLWGARERDRLAVLWREAALREGERLRVAGAHEDAIALALQLTDAFPERAATWSLRLAASDAPNTLGAQRETRADLEAALKANLLQGHDADAAQLLLTPAHIASSATSPPLTPAARPPAIPPYELPLVGRGPLLNRLLGVALGEERVGSDAVILLKGAAGLGKSRLLRELARRLEDKGKPVVYLTTVAAERSASWAFLARLVRILVHQPGGPGLAPEYATALLGIAPDLRARLGGATRFTPGAPDTDALAAATADLLSAAHEARPFTLLLDDLQFADRTSLDTLAMALRRLGGDGPTLIAGSRPEALLPSHWPRWQLPPLNRDELVELWDRALAMQLNVPMRDLADATMLITGGIPIYVARAIQQLEAAGLLERYAHGRWRATAFEALPDAVANLTLHRDPRFPSDRVARAILGYLTAAREPVVSEEIYAVLHDLPPTDLAEVLDRLVVAGWVTIGEHSDTITLTHALLGEQVLAAVGDVTIDGYQQLHAIWLARHGTTLGQLQHLMQVLVVAGRGDAALTALRQWQQRTGQRLTGMTDLLAPVGASRVFRARLRLALSPNGWVAPLAIAMVVIVAGFATDAWFRMPVALYLENAPVMVPVRDANQLGAWRSNDNPPVFRVQDRLGRPSDRLDGDTLTVMQLHGDAQLSMQAPAVVRNGLVAAAGLVLRDVPAGTRDSVVARFAVASGRSHAVTLFRPGLLSHTLQLAGGTVSGQRLTEAAPTIRVTPGAPITGEILLRYTTPSDPIIYMLAESSTFADPSSDTLTVGSLHYNATNGFVGVRVARTAPTTPGTYWLAWVSSPETAAVWILSGTNWRCGTPQWADGNDLMVRDDLASVWGGGTLSVQRRLCDGPGTPEWLEHMTPAVTVRVEVRE